jgi:YesN/AraC family two-component response regulator
MLRVVIADDEGPARSFLAAILRGFEDVKLVGEAENGAEAIELIEREKPDLALLDLQMPEIDGLGVVRLLKKSRMPLIAFVTAYDEYAVRPFELNAVDYLLKPVDKARLRDALNRAQERLERAELRPETRTEAAARVDAAVHSPASSDHLSSPITGSFYFARQGADFLFNIFCFKVDQTKFTPGKLFIAPVSDCERRRTQ